MTIPCRLGIPLVAIATVIVFTCSLGSATAAPPAKTIPDNRPWQIIFGRTDICEDQHLIVRQGQETPEIISMVSQLMAYSFNSNHVYAVYSATAPANDLENFFQTFQGSRYSSGMPDVTTEDVSQILASKTFQSWAGAAVISAAQSLIVYHNDTPPTPNPEKEEPIDKARKIFLKALQNNHGIKMMKTEIDCY